MYVSAFWGLPANRSTVSAIADHGTRAFPHGVPVWRAWYTNVESQGMKVRPPTTTAAITRVVDRRVSPGPARTARMTRSAPATARR